MKEDMKGITEQLSRRVASKLKIKEYKSEEAQSYKNLFILSESDLGVIRNGGRRGSAYGPSAIINTLKKMSTHRDPMCAQFSLRTMGSCSDFSQQQEQDIQKLSTDLKTANLEQTKFWHLGAGHDHVYPYLKWISQSSKKILIINIDAHLDTRVDELPHSGTPFRQFANDFDGDLEILQLGIHDFANELSNYNELKSAKMTILSMAQIKNESANFSNVSGLLDKYIQSPKEYKIVLSLDCDAICAEQMEAVSAVNHHGLDIDTVREIFSWYFSLAQKEKYCGIYEYNPIYDNLSNKGARVLSSLIQPFL